MFSISHRHLTYVSVVVASATISACGEPECPDGAYKVGNVCRRIDAGLRFEEGGAPVVVVDGSAQAPVVADGSTQAVMTAQDDAASSPPTIANTGGLGQAPAQLNDAAMPQIQTSDGGDVELECDVTRPCSSGYSCTGGKCISACSQAVCDPNATCALAAGVATCTCNSGFITQGSGASLTCVRDKACSELGCDANATCQVGADQLRHCACKVGYTGDGTSCTAIGCAPLTIENGTVTGGNTYNQMSTYRCNQGYKFATGVGSIIRTCGADMNWSGSAPRCDSVSCGVPPAVPNATVSPSASGTYRGTATYTCASTHGLSGNASVTCQIDGTWTSPPRCVALPVCGNGAVETGEDCDPEALFQDAWKCNPKTCKRTTAYNACPSNHEFGLPNSACSSGEVCTLGICTPNCTTNTQCPDPPVGFQKACSVASQTCLAGGCRTEGDCPHGLACIIQGTSSACLGCSSDDQCQSHVCIDNAGGRAPFSGNFGLCQ